MRGIFDLSYQVMIRLGIVFESTGEGDGYEDENDEVTRVVLFELLGKK